jgi:hypothetical protein
MLEIWQWKCTFLPLVVVVVVVVVAAAAAASSSSFEKSRTRVLSSHISFPHETSFVVVCAVC